MLTTEDKEDIRRIVAETLHLKSTELANDNFGHAKEIEYFERIMRVAFQLQESLSIEGFLDLEFVNPKTGDRRKVRLIHPTKSIVEVTARAMEVFGTREKALRWLNTPVHSLGDRTPLSLLITEEGVAQVLDTLGRVEHGIW